MLATEFVESRTAFLSCPSKFPVLKLFHLVLFIRQWSLGYSRSLVLLPPNNRLAHSQMTLAYNSWMDFTGA